MAALDFGDPARAADLVFVHANGFNARTYRALLEPLASSYRILAPDLRGHGLTRLSTENDDRWSWRDHRDDLVAFLDALQGPPLVLAGHSMGATTSLLAAAERPDRVRGLVLLDPVIWTRPAVLALQLPLIRHTPRRIPLFRNALRRRRDFDTRGAALKAYRGRGAFRNWPDEILADYLADGLTETETETGVTLACTPEWEASNYAAQSHDPWAALNRYPGPVSVLKAETASPTALTPANTRARVTVVEGGDHFFPMVKPEVAHAALIDALTASPAA